LKITAQYRLQFIYLLFACLLLIVGVWLSQYGLNVKSIIFYCIIHLFFLVFFTYVLSRIHLFYHSKSAISAIHLGIITMFCVLGVWSSYGLNSVIFARNIQFIGFLKLSLPVTVLLYFLFLLLSANQFWIDKHIQEEERIIQQLIQKERALAKAELSNIQEQFRPHFIFNSLNSISALTGYNPNKAREMIQLLSDFLRASVIREEVRFHTLAEEFHFLNLYLSIEKVRFEDRLSVEMPDLKDLSSVKIPVMILQPVLENAIKFGIYGTVGSITITIEVEEKNEELKIRISNPYDLDSMESSKGKGYGLDSIRKKMYLLYHRNDLVEVMQSNEKFIFQLSIPKE